MHQVGIVDHMNRSTKILNEYSDPMIALLRWKNNTGFLRNTQACPSNGQPPGASSMCFFDVNADCFCDEWLKPLFQPVLLFGNVNKNSWSLGKSGKHQEQKSPEWTGLLMRKYAICGGWGIRTPGTLRYAGFQDRCDRPTLPNLQTGCKFR